MRPEESSDRRPTKLTTRIAHGDVQAERELVSQCSTPVLRMLLGITRNRDLADDLHQDTFLILLRRLRQGVDLDDDAIPHYARSIALHLLANHRRKTLRRCTESLLESQQVLDPRPGALASVLEREQRRIVVEALQRLPRARDRALLYRVYFAEEERERVCAALKLPHAHLKRVLFRARQRLRALLPPNFARRR